MDFLDNKPTDKQEILAQLHVAKAIIDSSFDAIFLITTDLKFFFVNSSACKMLGYSAHELLGKDIKLVTENTLDQKTLANISDEIAQKGRAVVETMHKTKSQKMIPVEIVITKMSYFGQEFFCSVARDITDRKEMEFALRSHEKSLLEINSNLESRVEEEIQKRIEKEQLLSAVYDSSNIAISVTDESGKFIYINKSFANLFGYKQIDLIGESFLMLVRDEAKDIVGLEYKKFINNEVVDFPSEHEIVRKDGEKRVALVSRKTITTPDNKIILVSFFVDITKQKMLEIEYKKQEELLIEQSRLASMGEMISAIAHQWRQPLNTTAVLVQGLLFDFEMGTLTKESLKSAVEESMSQLKHMSSTIDSFRNFTKNGKVKEQFDVVSVVKEAVMLISAQLTSHQIFVRYIESVDSFVISGFAGELKQVVLNILLNARDVLIERKIDESEIAVEFERVDNKIKISIADNAGGIEDGIISRVFDPYFTTKEQTNGTGIGLYMSRMIVERSYKGTISVKNRRFGACFEIILQGDLNA